MEKRSEIRIYIALGIESCFLCIGIMLCLSLLFPEATDVPFWVGVSLAGFHIFREARREYMSRTTY